MNFGKKIAFGDYFIQKKELGEEDMPTMVSLFEDGYEKSPPESYFRWKYLNPPEGKAIVYQAVTQAGEVVSTYSAIPVVYFFKGQEKMAYLAMDATTRPEHQGKRLFSTLAKTICEDLSSSSNTFVIGYPAPIPFKAYVNKLGWLHIADARPLFLPYSRLRPLQMRLRSLFKKPLLRWESVSRFGETLDAYFEKKKNFHVPIQKKYSAAILNWHTVDYPEKSFNLLEFYDSEDQVVGYAVWRYQQKDVVEILKLDFLEDSFFEAYTFDFIAQLTAQTGARNINLWETFNPPLRKALLDAGFVLNLGDRPGYGSHSFPVTLYAQQEELEGIDLRKRENYELDIFTRDFL